MGFNSGFKGLRCQSLKLHLYLTVHCKGIWSQSSVCATRCSRTCRVLRIWNLMCPSYGLLRMSFFWDMTLCCWVNGSWHLEGTFTLWNFTNCVRNKTVSQPKRLCIRSNTAAGIPNLTSYTAFTNYLTEPAINQSVLNVYCLIKCVLFNVQ